jgi:hypothetical protein
MIEIKNKHTGNVIYEHDAQDLRGANLRGANLRWADLREADLRWADLREADLIGADLREADLRWANLIGADLRGANLIGANLIVIQGSYTAYITSESTRIGCEVHASNDWVTGKARSGLCMEYRQLWDEHKDIIIDAIKTLQAKFNYID